MVINDQPNMHMHALIFHAVRTHHAGRPKVISNHQISQTPAIFGAYSTLPLTPPRHYCHYLIVDPSIPGLMDVRWPTLVTKTYPNYTRSLRVGSLLHFGITVSGHRISIGVIKSTGGSHWALIHFMFSGHALLSGYAWNWSCYWSCLLSIETSCVTSFMDCIGYFFLCGYYSIMHVCMAMVEPVILHPPFIPFFTVQALHHLDRAVGGWKPAFIVGIGTELGESIVYNGFRKHTNTSTQLD